MNEEDARRIHSPPQGPQISAHSVRLLPIWEKYYFKLGQCQLHTQASVFVVQFDIAATT